MITCAHDRPARRVRVRNQTAGAGGRLDSDTSECLASVTAGRLLSDPSGDPSGVSSVTPQASVQRSIGHLLSDPSGAALLPVQAVALRLASKTVCVCVCVRARTQSSHSPHFCSL